MRREDCLAGLVWPTSVLFPGHGETRSGAVRILVVVWTMRGNALRPVTAFEAGKQLASDYLKQKG